MEEVGFKSNAHLEAKANTSIPGDHPPRSLPERLDGLTALRAIAASAVVLLHFHVTTFRSLGLGRYIPFVSHYYLGVDLFFILSGFILAHVHGRDFARLTPSNTAQFYILRLARIYPAHVTVLMMYVCLFLLLKFSPYDGIGLRAPADHYTASALIAHLLLVSPGVTSWNSPAWSVSAEWSAYLWFPLLAFALRRASPRFCVIALVGIVGGFADIYFQYFNSTMDHLGLLRVSFEFPAGYLIYRASYRTSLSRVISVLAPVVGLGLLLLATDFAEFGFVLLIGAIVAITGHRSTVRRHWHVPHLLIWLGEISYSVYIIHALVMATAGRAAEGLLPRLSLPLQLALVPVLFMVVVVCAAMLHRIVEKPARDWMRTGLFQSARAVRDRFRAMALYTRSL
ncbi:MAG TPA: acyltransferase [Stellaceae bacterium]|nr:acyltransferase [Stellaceae bacterium]